MHKQRIFGLDVFRGWAILLMVLFHFSYDLNYFKFISINFSQDTFWVYARFFIVNMFLLSVGVSLALTHRPFIQWKKMYKRTILLGGASILVSIGTYIQFPQAWVYFGILHFILIASWVGLFFLPYPKISLLIAMIIIPGYYFGYLHTQALFSYLKMPLHLPIHTTDLVPFFPWFATILIGMCLVHFDMVKSIFYISFLKNPNPFNQYLSFMGRHALILYLIHQPILFGIFYLLF